MGKKRLHKEEIVKIKQVVHGGQGLGEAENGKKIFIQAFEERLKETIKHRSLNRKVSYKRLVRLECYKLAKYILRMEDQYQAFKIYW